MFQTTVFDWPYAIAVGLKGTENPRPPKTLPSDFRSKKHFRAMTHFNIDSTGLLSGTFTDPGYTPPFSVKKVPNIAGAIAKWSDDGQFHAGEQSSLSGIVAGKLHPNSTLEVPNGASVLASVLVKFRAGDYTNKIGLEKAGSPFHVPWVWCEHALIEQSGGLVLLANGSAFPSHAWYSDGKLLGTLIQNPVNISSTEPAFSSGAPATQSLPPTDESSSAPIDTHSFTIGKRRSTHIPLNV